MIQRFLESTLIDRLLHSNKVVILYGARQVGKTTLAKKVIGAFPGRVLEVNADRLQFHDVLSSRDLSLLNGLVSGYDLLFIDEAQRIPDIGINLKILHDHLPSLKIMVTGSSSFDLANRVREPLTGRTWTYRLFPISVKEWQQHSLSNDFEVNMKLEEWLRFGLYPETLGIESYQDKRSYLDELSGSYLYKDILALSNIRYPEKLRQLLKLLAYQIGQQISVHELSNALQVNRDTVLNYLDLLEKGFVIFRLGAFSRNLRKELVKMDKIYFYDLGIRNAIIEDFSPVEGRSDIGQMWENFLIAERRKQVEYKALFGNSYFWRTYTGSELDYVEERDGRLRGFEMKWKNKTAKAPQAWLDTYQQADYTLVNGQNYLDFIG